jgi:hypothetical protein
MGTHFRLPPQNPPAASRGGCRSLAAEVPALDPRPSTAGRRGMATLVVLLLISIALAISYATMRSQATIVAIQQNAHLATDARQAAITGLTIGLKKMHQGDWAGVNTTLSGSLGADQGYLVTYAAGDPSLSQGDPDYADLPYRVTLASVGYAVDPADPARKATHTARAVVRLVPRKLPDEPSDWDRMQQYAVYQTKKESFEIDLPCQLSGAIRVQSKFKLIRHYPNDSDAWWTYLDDLNRMRKNNLPDYRPVNGRVDWPSLEQDLIDVIALQVLLGVPTSHLDSKETGSDWVKPSAPAEYRIYQGGPVYAVTPLPGTLENTILGPDPLVNPLGLYSRDGSLDLLNNVTIRGTLFCKDEIRVVGTGVNLEPVDLPSLYGEVKFLRLPMATCQKFKVKPAAGGGLRGLLAVFGDFEVEKGTETTAFAISGKVITRLFLIREREPWNWLNWKDYYAQFKVYRSQILPAVAYFPDWMGTGGRGRDPNPRLTIRPDTGQVRYHWHNPYRPIFIPHPDDATALDPNNPGLRWDLLEWDSG